MKKRYNQRKIKRQAIGGWMLLASGFALQLVLEKLLWGESRPSMAVYIVGVPFVVGGFIFAKALVTILHGEPERPMHFFGHDFQAIYQANMAKLLQRLPVSLFFAFGGFGCFFLFILNYGQMFFIGLPSFGVGVTGMLFLYNRYARCPGCNHLPTTKAHNGVAINLATCPNCGAKLGDGAA